MAHEYCVSTLLSCHSKSELKTEGKLESQVVAIGGPCASPGEGHPSPRGTMPAKCVTGKVYTDGGISPDVEHQEN